MDSSGEKSGAKDRVENSSSFGYGTPSQNNVSFSFNLDLENFNEDFYSDSGGELEIDVSEIDNYETQNERKRKREMDQDISVFNKMEEEIERQLDAKAARTNLTAKNVKNILKHVITNEHVMAMVKRRAYNLEDDLIFEPKLTRAKAKELAMSQPDIPWPITPIKKPKGSEVQVLIEEELPEDSSDEEYHPGQDEPSDDERETEGNSVSSDIDSQPATPATPADQQPVVEEPQLKIVDIQYDEGGVFKVPEAPPAATSESGNIGQRTRSKLCLSETPLEQIEQAFVPPDITTDMYDWDWDVDEDWNNFLKEFTQPLTQEIIGEDDPEADPEYNILEDEESDLLDKEELRMDKAVKVTRKELNNLVAELFEFADMFSKENQDVTKKKKSPDTMNSTTENTSINGSVIELLPVLAESNLPKLISNEQRVLLHVQLCQHIQLMAQHFALTYMHPEFHSQAKMCKDNLNSLQYLSNGENSAFNAINLPDALELVSELEKQFKDPKSRHNYIDFLNQEIHIGKARFKQKIKYIPKYYPAIKKLLLKGKALIYPQLLPEIPFGHCPKQVKTNTYLKSEDQLIVLGLEQFIPFVSLKQTKFKNEKMKLFDTAQLISQYLVPNKDPSTLFKHINRCRTSRTKNPIQEWYKSEKVRAVIHCVLPVSKNDLKAPEEQPINMLSVQWQKMFADSKNPSNEQTQIRLQRICKDLLKPSQFDTNCNSKTESIPSNCRMNHNLLNPTVNMLPAMPFLNTPVKNTEDSDKSEDSLKTPDENMKKWCINSGSQELPNIEFFYSPSSVQSHVGETVKDIGLEMSVESVCQAENICTDTTLNACKQSENISTEIGLSLESNLNIDTLKEMEKIHISEDLTVKEEISSNLQGISSDSVTQLEETKEQANIPSTTEKPQLRTTTPRLAKIRSAQNMKMMAQILGNKSPAPNTSGVKPRGKKGGSKNSEEPSTSNNGDNEDEIAELMLASTTIKKDQKRAKQARELENIKRLVEAENDLSQEERATKFAVSFLHKLHKALDPSSEIFKAIIKLFLDYNERIDTLNQTENEGSYHSEQTRDERSLCSIIAPLGDEQPSNSQCIIESVDSNSTSQVSKDLLTIDLYKDVCEKLVDYPELNSDFLLFLKPHQAAMIDKSVEHTMLQKMTDFVDIAQIYFAKQPSKLSKVMQAITQLATDTDVNLETVNDVMENLLKGHPLVMDTFLQVLPNGKPPESLFAQHMFENLTCPPGPHDKTKIYTEDAPELYENIEIPVSSSQEDPYGGDNCKCECHNLDGHNLKSRSEHCVSCGTRFLNGRIYLQTTEGLRPAKLTFPGGDDEKKEHITRVSLNPTEKLVPATPKRRRKSSKNSPDQTDAKANKNSPIKDSEEMDKSSLKSKRMNKISIKSRERKKSPNKNIEISSKLSSNDNLTEKKECMSPIKTKREERAEKREAQDISRSRRTKVAYKNTVKSTKILDLNNADNATQSQTDDTSQDENSISDYGKVHDIEEESKLSTNNCETEETVKLEKMEVSSDSGSDAGHEIWTTVDIRPWTRQEDAILLECIKKEYSENTFLTISETLGDRTVQQVKERFEILLSLLEKMA